MFCSWIPFLSYPKKFPWLFNKRDNYPLLFLPLVFIVLTVVIHAIFVVNTVILFVFKKWVFVKTSKFSSTRKNCTFCNRLGGHIVDTCYKKHGFPPGYKSINRTSQANNMFTTNSSSESFSTEQDVKGFNLHHNTDQHFASAKP